MASKFLESVLNGTYENKNTDWGKQKITLPTPKQKTFTERLQSTGKEALQDITSYVKKRTNVKKRTESYIDKNLKTKTNKEQTDGGSAGGRMTVNTLDELYNAKGGLEEQIKKAPTKEKEGLIRIYNQVNKDIKTKESQGETKTPFLKKTAKTAVSAGTLLGKGAVKAIEGKLDTAVNIGTSKYNPYYLFGNNADRLERDQQMAQEFIQRDSTQELMNMFGYDDKLSTGKTIQETLDENSMLKSGTKEASIVESVGQNVLSAFLGAEASSLVPISSASKFATKATTAAKDIVESLPFAATSYGSSLEEAYKGGANRKLANQYSLLNTALELGTEHIYTNIGSTLRLGGAVDDVFTKKITSKISNSLFKKITEIGLGAVAEGGEEVVGELINPILKKLTYMNETDLTALYENANILDAFVGGAIGGAVLGTTSIAVNDKTSMVNESIKELNNIVKTSKNKKEVELATKILSNTETTMPEAIKPSVEQQTIQPSVNVPIRQNVQQQENIQAKDNTGKVVPNGIAEKLKYSKVRDTNGNLREVYHGTNAEFDKFDKSYLGSGSGDLGFLGDGIYFATHKGEAEYYGRMIKPVYLDVKNPFNIKELNSIEGTYFDGERANPYIEIRNLTELNSGWNNVEINNTNFGNIKNKVDNYIKNIKINDAGLGEDANGDKIRYWEVMYNGKKEIIQSIPNYTKEQVLSNHMNKILRDEVGFINENEISEYLTDYKRFQGGKSLADVLQENGYDGVIQGNDINETDEIVVFDPKQIINVDTFQPTTAETIPSETITTAPEAIKPSVEQQTTSEQQVIPQTQNTIPKETQTNIPSIIEKESVPNVLQVTPKQLTNPQQNISDKTIIKPIETTDTKAKIITKLSKEKTPIKQKAVDIVEAVYQNTVDDLYQIQKMANKSKNGYLYYLANNVRQSSASANFMIGQALLDNEGNIVGKSLADISKEMRKVGVDNASDYLLNLHNIDRSSQGKPVFGENVTADISQENIKKYSSEEYKQISKDINTFTDYQLNMLVESGLISEQTKQTLQTMYPNYVPTYREQTGTKGSSTFGKNISVKTPIRKAVGGDSRLMPIIDSLARQTQRNANASKLNILFNEMYNTVLQNPEAMKDFAVIVESDGENFNIDGEDSPVSMKKVDDGYKVNFFVAGNKASMYINKNMFDGIQEITGNSVVKSITSLPVIKQLGSAISGFKQVVTGINPLFTVTNFAKDLQDSIINSKETTNFVKKYPKAWGKILTNSKEWQLYRSLGAEQSSFFDFDTGGIKEKSSNLVVKGGQYVIQGLEKANMIVEQVPRFDTFLQYYEKDKSYKGLMKAMFESADVTVNFGRGGKVIRLLDKTLAPYLNPAVQGLDKTIRNVTENVKLDIDNKTIKNASKYLVKLAILGAGMRLLNDLMHGDDDDYQELNDYEKDTNWILWKYGKGKFVKIPKGRQIAAIGIVASRMYDDSLDKKVGFETATSLLAPQNPFESNFLTPMIESLKAERGRTWYGSDIIPDRLKDLPTTEQYDEKTTSTAIAMSKWLSKVGIEISPKSLDYGFKQYSGIIGQVTIPLLTPQAERNPIIAKFTADSVYNNKNLSTFYNKYDRLTEFKNSTEYNISDKETLQLKYLGSINYQINELNAQKREIQMADMSNKDKKVQVEELNTKINELAKKTLSDIENFKQTDNYSKVGNISYFKNKNNEWTKVADDNKSFNLAINSNLNMTEFVKYKNVEFKANKNNKGESISGSRFKKVFEYVNGLKLTTTEKAIIIKMEYSTYKKYDDQIINYIKNQKLTIDQKQEYLEYLGFTIKNGKVYK